MYSKNNPFLANVWTVYKSACMHLCKTYLFFRDTFHYSNVSFSCLFSLRFKDLFLVDVDIIEGTRKEILNKTAELQSTHFAPHIFDFRNLVKVEFK